MCVWGGGGGWEGGGAGEGGMYEAWDIEYESRNYPSNYNAKSLKTTVKQDYYIVRLSLLTMTNPNQMREVLLFVCIKMADEINLSSELPVADRTRDV